MLERVLIAYRDERERDESFGRWVDRQPEGRMQELVGTQLDEGGIPGSTAYSDPQSLPQVLVIPGLARGRTSTTRDARSSRSREDPTLYPSAHIVGARSIDSGRPARRRRPAHRARARSPAARRARHLARPHDRPLRRSRQLVRRRYAFWLLRRLGHRDLRLLDGGRRRWIGEDRPVNADDARTASSTTRCRRWRCPASARSAARSRPCSPSPARCCSTCARVEEYEGTTTHDPAFPREAAERAGHIPGAVHIPWEAAVREDGTVRPLVELRGVFEQAGVKPEQDVIVYCRIGERASHTWLVLQELLGYPRVRVYDGSWTEWAQHHDLPIAVAAAVGSTRRARAAKL